MKSINNDYIRKFQKKIQDIILANSLIEPGEGVVAGVSGGLTLSALSMCSILCGPSSE